MTGRRTTAGPRSVVSGSRARTRMARCLRASRGRRSPRRARGRPSRARSSSSARGQRGRGPRRFACERLGAEASGRRRSATSTAPGQALQDVSSFGVGEPARQPLPADHDQARPQNRQLPPQRCVRRFDLRGLLERRRERRQRDCARVVHWWQGLRMHRQLRERMPRRRQRLHDDVPRRHELLVRLPGRWLQVHVRGERVVLLHVRGWRLPIRLRVGQHLQGRLHWQRCQQTCRSATSCAITACTNGCQVTCGGSASCELSCSPANGGCVKS